MSEVWSAHGKWILSGEHSVLRGCPALVFPLFSKKLQCEWRRGENPLVVEFAGSEGEPLKLLFWGVVEAALQKSGRNREELKGHLSVTNDLPLGAGLGASAALCVAVGLWWQKMGWLAENEVYEFSRQLENLFHGESSGVDIAAALATQGLRFMRGGERTPLKMKWRPRIYVSYCGQRGVTSECVSRVKDIAKTDETKFRDLDQCMQECSLLAEEALTQSDESKGVAQLAESLNRAHDVFCEWGLVEGPLKKHIALLKEAGALAVKPTGSGGGGHVISLWKIEPPSGLGLVPGF